MNKYVWFISKVNAKKAVSILNNSKNEKTLILKMNMLCTLCNGLVTTDCEVLEGRAEWYKGNTNWLKIEYAVKGVTTCV